MRISSLPGGRALCICLCFQLLFFISPTASAHVPQHFISLSVDNSPLDKVCREIERQTGYYFVLPASLVELDIRVTAKFSDVALEDALKRVLSPHFLKFQIIDKVVIVRVDTAEDTKRPKDFELGIHVKGTVMSAQGSPLSDATVTVKSTGKTTLTNYKGEFEFTNIPNNSVLVVSFVGYATQQIVVKEGINAKVILSLSANEMDATVVKGYYSTSNRLNTGNITVVKGSDIAKQPVTDPLLALEARVPGLYIEQSSGMAGSYSNVQFRGRNTIPDGKPKTSNDPFYIVDGIPFSSQTLTTTYFSSGIFGNPSNDGLNNINRSGLSPFDNLSPTEIESIEVLKDADATAIYGSRGANGVILITTKRGKAGETKLDFSWTKGAGKISRRVKLLSTKDYLTMRREAFKNDGLSITNYPTNYDINGFWDTTRYTDWQRVIANNASLFDNFHFGLSGGTGSLQFLLGADYSRQGTSFLGKYGDRKVSFNAAVNHSYGRFNLGFSGSFLSNNNNAPAVNLANLITLAPDAPAVYDNNGNINWQNYHGTASWNNPVASIANRSKATTNLFMGSLNLGVHLLTGLEFTTKVGTSISQFNQNQLTLSGSFAPPGDNNPNNRQNQTAVANAQSWIVEPQLNYSINIFRGQLSTLIGGTFQSSTSSSSGFLAYGFASDALVNNAASAPSYTLLGSGNAVYRYNALFGRIGYDWDGKYVFNFTMRRDGSSRFGSKKQFGNFGALGVAWIFTKENWFKDIPLISFGKIRTSYGITGNDAIADYQFVNAYSPANAAYQNSSTLYPTNLGNPYLQWEKVRKYELGLDLGFLNDILRFNISYYQNRTNNQLTNYILPTITGFTFISANLPALIENTGIEMVFSSTNIRTMNFSWTSSVNISMPKNKLASFPNIETSAYYTLYQVGKSMFSRMLYHYTGVDPLTGLYTFQTKKGNSSRPSFPDDAHWSKPITTDYYGGFDNSFTYKRFQLDVLFQFVHKLGYNYLSNIKNPGLYNTNQLQIVMDRWQKAGDQSGIAKFSSDYNPTARNIYRNYLQNSDAVVSDASFVRLKNISLSYQIPEAFKRKMKLKSCSVYYQCQNLLTITKYLGWDPESTGLNLPPLRMMTGGIRISL